ncbi:MAG: SPFH domain-containing protein [Anaerolineae bacterium]
MSLDVTIFYSIDPAKANQVYQRWPRTDPDVAGYSVYIRSTARTVVRDVVATFRADAIYGQGRTAMQQQINDQMAIKLAQEGFNLNAVNVRGLQFSEQFTQAIENKNAADQAAQQAQIVVQQREREADQLRAQAQGERDAAITRAEGAAQATILQARAEAEALRLVSEQIAANPTLIQYQYIQTLGDNIRLALVPSNSPFLFDFESIAANPDFVAPEVPDSSDIFTPSEVPTATPQPGSGG